MYQFRNNLILAFHGCDETTRDKIVNHSVNFKPSENSYDWLGNGMYFWENNYQRAYEWAELCKNNPQNNKQKIHKPAVVGAVISLGHCLDLLESHSIEELETSFNIFQARHIAEGKNIGRNIDTNNSSDKLIRILDCAVIQLLHQIRSEMNEQPYDSVRAAFFEGGELYPTAGFQRKTHIQICIRNPNCIKGYFIPRKTDPSYSIV